MVDRIKKIIEKEGTTASVFADLIGISRSAMNHILNGRNKPSLDILMKILANYPDINSEWLLFDKPPMYKGEKAYLQPTLFDDNSVESVREAINPEYRKEKEVKQIENISKQTKTEEIKRSILTSKKIDKIMIFYTDHTFVSFSPENE